MRQLHNFGDERQTTFCAYCGRGTETRDHVPSKVFLDKPYPDNLPVIYACQLCNQGFSMDEEYVACLVECAVVGSVNENDIQRRKIKRILRRKPALAARLSQARQMTDDGAIFNIEADRVSNVVLKLGRGHAAFEMNEPQLGEPCKVAFIPFPSMTPEIREYFETPPQSSLWPEVGSRAMQRLVTSSSGETHWIIAQPGRYRYFTLIGERVLVRVVINEYLGCEITWD